MKNADHCPCFYCSGARQHRERSRGLMLRLAVDLIHRPREVFAWAGPGHPSVVELSVAEIMLYHGAARRMAPSLFGRSS